MSVDQVCRKYATQKKVKIKLTIDDGMVFIEGSTVSLEFLGELLLAHAKGESGDCGFDISPTGAGKVFFDPASQAGIYLHRLRCEHEETQKPSPKDNS